MDMSHDMSGMDMGSRNSTSSSHGGMDMGGSCKVSLEILFRLLPFSLPHPSGDLPHLLRPFSFVTQYTWPHSCPCSLALLRCTDLNAVELVHNRW